MGKNTRIPGIFRAFPTGLVEKQNQIGLSLRYYPSTHVGIEVILSRRTRECGPPSDRTDNPFPGVSASGGRGLVWKIQIRCGK